MSATIKLFRVLIMGHNGSFLKNDLFASLIKKTGVYSDGEYIGVPEKTWDL